MLRCWSRLQGSIYIDFAPLIDNNRFFKWLVALQKNFDRVRARLNGNLENSARGMAHHLLINMYLGTNWGLNSDETRWRRRLVAGLGELSPLRISDCRISWFGCAERRLNVGSKLSQILFDLEGNRIR